MRFSKRLLCSLTTLICLFSTPSYAGSDQLPSAEQVTGIVKLCGAGLTTSIEGAVEARLKLWRLGEGINGKGSLAELSGILSNLNKGQQVDEKVFQIFTKCIESSLGQFLQGRESVVNTKGSCVAVLQGSNNNVNFSGSCNPNGGQDIYSFKQGNNSERVAFSVSSIYIDDRKRRIWLDIVAKNLSHSDIGLQIINADVMMSGPPVNITRTIYQGISECGLIGGSVVTACVEQASLGKITRLSADSTTGFRIIALYDSDEPPTKGGLHMIFALVDSSSSRRLDVSFLRINP